MRQCFPGMGSDVIDQGGFTKNGGNGYRVTVLKFLDEWMIGQQDSRLSLAACKAASKSNCIRDDPN